MTGKAKELPDWAAKYQTRGHLIRENNGHYYLYRRTSKRIPGLKYPKQYEVYVGRITEADGIVPGKRILIDVSEIQVYEYGYSLVMIELCPEEWKRNMGSNWKNILMAAIVDASPESYVKKLPEFDGSCIGDPCVKVQRTTLYRKIREKYDADKDELLRLKGICMLEFTNGKRMISKINESQMATLKKLGMEIETVLEVCP